MIKKVRPGRPLQITVSVGFDSNTLIAYRSLEQLICNFLLSIFFAKTDEDDGGASEPDEPELDIEPDIKVWNITNVRL